MSPSLPVFWCFLPLTPPGTSPSMATATHPWQQPYVNTSTMTRMNSNKISNCCHLLWARHYRETQSVWCVPCFMKKSSWGLNLKPQEAVGDRQGVKFQRWHHAVAGLSWGQSPPFLSSAEANTFLVSLPSTLTFYKLSLQSQNGW